MKKIIFDLDNTLMMFNDRYIYDYSSIINGTYEDGMKLYKSIGKYEDSTGIYNKKELLRFINEDMNLNYTMELFDKLLDAISNNWIYYVPDGTKEVLNYLYCKYELYVLTNWFSDCQANRLKHVELLKYFREIVGADKFKPKPNVDGYLYITGDTNKEDVIMIGDNVDIDIKGANDAGINSILIDYKNRYPDYEKRITDIKELKKIL